MRLLRPASLIAALTLWVASGFAAHADAEKIAAPAAREAALAGEMVLVDIRTPGEWAATGVPDAAHAINLDGPRFGERLQALIAEHPGTPVALICATGSRSAFVGKVLSDAGIDARDVGEGMLGSSAGPGWLARGLPLRTPDTPRVQGRR